MYTIFKIGIILCLVISCGCNGDKSETETPPDARQERTLKPSFSSANLLRSGSSQSVVNEAVPHVTPSFEAAIGEGCNDDVACLTLASHDRIGLEAIRSLHRQLDDDANGNVDLSESDEFLRQELQYEDGYERRQRVFHRNDDNHISVRELWEAWIRSEVHNWTVEQTSDWLCSSVELPQYAENFKLHKVTGAMLPRLAVNNMHYLSNVLGIKDPIHKQKIALKAMDVVLFGSPKDTGHSVKDLILVTALLLALTGCYYAYRKTKSSQNDVRRMIKHMESLRKAEFALDQLQKELEKARMEQEFVTTEKQNLERLLEKGENMELRTSSSDLEVSQLKAEIELLRGELKRAEGELEDRCWSPPVGLQQWLQLTHEIENKAYIKKKMAAEKQLQQAREACEKLRKKRSSLVGAFVSTHGKSIDDVDRSIVEARTSLNEVTQELQERVHRWKQIELLCGFNIINNSGLQYLESVLYRSTANGRGGSSMGLRGRMSSSQDDLDDDTSSLYSPSAGCLESFQWKEGADSSGSEAGKGELDDDFQTDSRSLTSNVHFIVGSDSWSEEMGKNRMSRSFSQDPSMILGDRESSPPNMSQSETCLDGKQQTTRITPVKKTSRDFSSREHGFRDSARDHGSRESSSRDHSSRESSAKDHGSRESSYKDHGSRESSGKDQASRESGSRDHGSREMPSREHVAAGHASKEHLLREPGKDHVTREISPRDLASQDRAVKELAIVPYERSSKEHVLRDPLAREGTTASRDQMLSKTEQMVTMDDETYSTDSNSTTEEDLRRKKRKLFPTFNRKHKTKTS